MLLKSQIKSKINLLVFILAILALFMTMSDLFIENYSYNNQLNNINNLESKFPDLKNHGSVVDYYEKQWLKNPTFNFSDEYWFNTSNGDKSDVNASIRSGQANYEILGDKRTFSLIADPPSASNWTSTINPKFPDTPDLYEITTAGCRVNHTFDDHTAIQNPCIHWDHNISLSFNISDYIITSASVKAIINATVDKNLDRYSDYIYGRRARVDPNYDVTTYSVGDYIRFYTLISDLEKNKSYEIAYFQTEEIGTGSPPGTDYLSDRYMISVPEEDLIYYISSVLSADYCNFTITLGIKLFIEDNVEEYYDMDTFNELIIKSLNFTFTYEKKIDRSTYISWSQIGDEINGGNVDILNATLNFKCKIDQEWTTASPNSELRILINNMTYVETIKLSSITNFFQDVKLGGFDVTSLILTNVNITTSIQVFLADEFQLDRKIKISIDDIFLEISYKITTPEDKTSINLLLNGEDKTLFTSVEIYLGESLNIALKYRDSSGYFISNATVVLTGISNAEILLTQNLTENFHAEEYVITIETKSFKGKDNALTINASKRYYETQVHTITLIIKTDKGISDLLPWIILLVLSIIMIGILSILILRSNVIIPRKRKKESDLLLRTQRFKDVRNIQSIIITLKTSGLPIFIRSYSVLKEENKTLFSGFIQAIILMGENLSDKSMKDIKMDKEIHITDNERMLELDFRYFHCLINEKQDLRIVLLLKEKASKRLKKQTSLLMSSLLLNLSEKLESWDGSVIQYKGVIPPILNEYLDLYYKEPFLINNKINLLKILREKSLTRMEQRLINVINSITKDNNTFELEQIIEVVSEEREDLIIDGIESLIKQGIIIHIDPKNLE